MSLALYAVIPTITAAAGITAGYLARMFIARNEQHIEVSDLRIALHDAKERIAEVNRQRNTGADQYYKLQRDHEQLKADHRSTAHHYAQCETDLIVTKGQLGVACDELLTYGVDIRADWAEQAEDWTDAPVDEQDQPDAATETPAWDDYTKQHPLPQFEVESPTEWLKKADIAAAVKASEKAGKRRPVLVPAQRDGGKS